jgi:hypothetical protein
VHENTFSKENNSSVNITDLNELLATICDKTGIFCERINNYKKMNRITGFGLGLLETYWLIISTSGRDLLEQCLRDNDCRREAINTALSVADIYDKNEYFFTISVKDIRRIIDEIKQLGNH